MAPTPEQVRGRQGMLFVERAALDAGCTLIAFPADLDTGIDAFIEFPGPEGARLVAVQVKKGDSFFDAQGARHQADVGHLRSWSNYAVPVMLVIVREDESDAFWMNVTQYVRERPDVPRRGSHVLRPKERFDVAALHGSVATPAKASDLGDAIAMLVSSESDDRTASLSLLYRFREDRRTPFCLSTAIRLEQDNQVMSRMCDFYSRYLPHPEVSFFDVDSETREYAKRILRNTSRDAILKMLDAFGDDEEIGDWSGMTEIYGIDEEEIWDRHAIIERGTVQQGIAEVIKIASSPEQLLAVASDTSVVLPERRTAAALFGYLGYTCALETLDALIDQVVDESLSAILFWLRYWIRVEALDGVTA